MKIPVSIETTASFYLGEIDVESPDEVTEKAYELWSSMDYDHPTLCHQCANAELGEWDIPEFKDGDVAYYFKEEA